MRNTVMRLCAVFVLLGLLLMTGCGNVPVNPTEPAATKEPAVSTTTPTEPELETGTLQALRQQLSEEGKRFAVAYLGYYEYDRESVYDFLENPGYPLLETYPFINDIPEKNMITSGVLGEVYCIVPVDPDAVIRVNGWRTEDGETSIYDKLLFEGTAPEGLLLVCNSAFQPDTWLNIDFSDGKTYNWHPKLDAYLYVEQLWGGENSDSQDGYYTLDFSLYSQMLLAQYGAQLADEESDWTIPAWEDLVGTTWFWDEYGSYYKYQVTFKEGTADVIWNLADDDGDNHYKDAPWTYEIKDGISVLTFDFGQFAGEKSYNLLVDKTDGLMYIAVDATQGELKADWEKQYRYLIPQTALSPMDMVGTWERMYSEVEGYVQQAAPGVCLVEISGESEDRLFITYTDNEFPNQNYADKNLLLTPGEAFAYTQSSDWLATVNHVGFNKTTYQLTLSDEGYLVICNSWTLEGAPMVSYEVFRRVS